MKVDLAFFFWLRERTESYLSVIGAPGKIKISGLAVSLWQCNCGGAARVLVYNSQCLTTAGCCAIPFTESGTRYCGDCTERVARKRRKP